MAVTGSAGARTRLPRLQPHSLHTLLHSTRDHSSQQPMAASLPHCMLSVDAFVRTTNPLPVPSWTRQQLQLWVAFASQICGWHSTVPAGIQEITPVRRCLPLSLRLPDRAWSVAWGWGIRGQHLKRFPPWADCISLHWDSPPYRPYVPPQPALRCCAAHQTQRCVDTLPAYSSRARDLPSY